jgi:DNA-binding GntR family transcriptional regulator
MNEGSLSLADRAYRELRSAIVDQRLEPGKAIVEAELAEMLGVSRTPVREALRRCELEGYLTREKNNRLVIALPTAEMVDQLFVLRTKIEVYAVRHAAVRISDAELARLDDLVRQDYEALSKPQTRKLAELNGEIHGTILKASRNRTLEALMRSFQGRPHGLRVFAVGTLEDRKQFVADHSRLVDLLRDGDADRACELVRTHLERARELLIQGLELDT